MRKLLSVSLAVLFAAVLSACEEQPLQPEQMMENPAASASHGTAATDNVNVPPQDEVWGDHKVWEMLTPRPVHDEPSHESHAPLYAIGQLGIEGDEHGTGLAHDHTVPVPPQNQGTYNAIWHVYFLLPTQSAVEAGTVETSGDAFPGLGELASKADIDGDGNLEELTSLSRIEQAREEGLVFRIDIEFDFLCPVRPAHEG